ncbi:hypothetical protein EYF80_062365 [Liparis tanakae]|uniref:Uncharacterized protein n=1 Tax=Liparis tanakae TaxID=230148 RepID=A0A4Z2EFS8_9TELE|nr:hypothetical protein EYF80_062365 [Liparis tanakae]
MLCCCVSCVFTGKEYFPKVGFFILHSSRCVLSERWWRWWRPRSDSFCGWFNSEAGCSLHHPLVPPPPFTAAQVTALVCTVILLKQTKRDQQAVTAYYTTVY